MFSWQRLHRELPLSAEELEDVFDSLDIARTGYLTLEAFSSGFSTCPAAWFSSVHTALNRILSVKYEVNNNQVWHQVEPYAYTICFVFEVYKCLSLTMQFQLSSGYL